jgi:hypothetical protein
MSMFLCIMSFAKLCCHAITLVFILSKFRECCHAITLLFLLSYFFLKLCLINSCSNVWDCGYHLVLSMLATCGCLIPCFSATLMARVVWQFVLGNFSMMTYHKKCDFIYREVYLSFSHARPDFYQWDPCRKRKDHYEFFTQFTK